MAKKIDLSGVKEFLFNHGEKIALGGCAALGVILGLWGVFGAAGAGNLPGTGQSYAAIFTKRAGEIQAGINQGAPDELLVKAVPATKEKDWAFYKSTHNQGPYIAIPDFPNDKRQRPRVLAIRNDSIKIEYVNGLVYYYDKGMTSRQERAIKGLELGDAPAGVGPGPGPGPGPRPRPFGGQPGPGGAGAGASLPFAKVGQPLRMIVVHAVFPMKKQIVEFQKALRMATQNDLFQNHDDLPKPAGLDIIRVEVLGPDKVSEPEIIVGYYDTPKFSMNKKLEEVLRNAIYDERSPEMMKEYVWAGLTMPMPKLANRQYPKFDIKGFEFDWAMMEDEEGANMAGGGPGGRPMPAPRKEFGPGPGIGLPGFKGFKGEKKIGPGPGMENEPKEPANEYNLKLMPEKDLAESNPGLVTRVFGGKEKRVDQDMNVFHALGRFPTIDENVQQNGPGPGPGPGPRAMPGGGPNNQEAYFHAWDVQINKDGVGPGPGPGPGSGPGPGVRPVGPPRGGEKKGPMGKAFEVPGGGANTPPFVWDRDAIVRFIDPDVKPGKTYKYFVRVRMANPNHNKPNKEVAFQDLALHAELPPSEWIETPEKFIPYEYNLYAMDQQLLDDWDANVGVPAKKGPPPIIKDARDVLNSTPFQIHQWVGNRKDAESRIDHVIGDWVVVERKLVKKGEPIGVGLTIHAPAWLEKKDTFEVTLNRSITKKDKSSQNLKGIHFDLLPEGGKAPILVDFHGGKRLSTFNQLIEETAVDALILLPDGSLHVLNSRDATDPAAGNNPVATERAERVLSVRRRLDEVMNGTGGGANPAMPKGRPAGPNLPGSKGGF